MPEAAAPPAIEPAPAAQEPLTTTLRPEAKAQLDKLNLADIMKLPQAPEPTGDPAKPAEPAAPIPPTTPTATPAPGTSSNVVLLPGDSAPAGSEPASSPATAEPSASNLPPTDEVFPETPPFEIRSEKGKANYGNQRKIYNEALHRVKELETQLRDRTKPDEAAAARVAELEARISEMSAVVERSNLLEHPAFIRQFEKPLNDLREQAGSLVQSAQLDPNEFARVMSLRGNDRIKALDQLTESIESPTLRRRLERVVEEIEAKETERGKVLSDVKGNLEKLTTEDKVRQHQQFEEYKKNLGSLVDGVYDFLGKEQKIAFFQKGEGPAFEKWNQQLEADRSEVMDMVLNCRDQSKWVGVTALGIKFPRLFEAFTKERQARIAAETKLAERDSSAPGLSGASTSTANGSQPAAETPKDFSLDGMRSWVKQNARGA